LASAVWEKSANKKLLLRIFFNKLVSIAIKTRIMKHQSPITNHLILSFLFSLLFTPPLISQYYVNLAWVQIDSQADTLYFSMPGQEPIEWSTSSLDIWGNLVTVGNVLQGPGDADILVTKYDSQGALLWQESYDGPAGGLDYGLTLITGNMGAVYVAGVVTDTSGYYDIMLLKYSSAGTLQWSRRWGGAAGLHDAPTALFLDSSGNLIVAGVTYSASSLTDWVVLKINDSGGLNWVRTYDYNNLYEIPVRVEEDSTGQFLVSGFSQSGITSWDMAQIPFAATDGSLGTESRQSISGIDLDLQVRVAHNETGELFIAGNAPGGGEKTLSIIKLNSELDIVWTATHAQSGYSLSVSSVGVDDENRVFVAATAAPSSGPRHALLLSFDEEGELRWQRPWRSLAAGGSAEAKAMRVAPSGNVAIACVTDSETTGQDFATLVFDVEGVLRVSKQLNSISYVNDSPTDLNFVDDKAVYVTGTAKGGGVVRYLTAKYELMKQGTEVVVVDSVPAWMSNELIVKFSPELIDTSFVDNIHRQFAELDSVIPDSVVSDLEYRMVVSLDRVTAVKIFTRMTTGHTLSIARLGDTIPIPPFWSTLLLIFPENLDIDSLVAGLNLAEEWVEYAEYNYAFQLATEANDPYFLSNQQLSLHAYEEAEYLGAHINILPAWQQETGKDYVKAGVYDSPVFWAHEDFGDGTYNGSQIKGGWDYNDNKHISEVTDPKNSHGTAVAGIIGARRDNEKGVAGIAGGGEDGLLVVNPGIQIFSMGIFNDQGISASESKIADAIYEGAKYNPSDPGSSPGYGLHIMNHSWEGPFSHLLSNSVSFAFHNDVVTIASRGNKEGDQTPAYPACLDDDWVINVGGSGTDGKFYRGLNENAEGNGHFWTPEPCLPRKSYNYGGGVDILAPCVTELVTTLIVTDDPFVSNCQGSNAYPSPFGENNSYQAFNGTSASASHAAGVAALMLSKHHISQGQPNNLGPEDVEFIMQKYATDIVDENLEYEVGYDEFNGWGRLNAGEAVEHVSLPCWTVWHSGLPSQTSVDFDSTYVESTIEGDFTFRRYKVTYTYSEVFSPEIELESWWYRRKDKWGIGPLFTSPKWAEYDVSFQQGVLDASVVTYMWSVSDEYSIFWTPPLEEIKTMFSLHLKSCLSLSEEIILQASTSIQLFPNPANSLLNARWDKGFEVSRIEVISPGGQVLKMVVPEVAESLSEIDISGLSPGLYFVRLIGANRVVCDSFIKM
jgi:subtilisin family serine protease